MSGIEEAARAVVPASDDYAFKLYLSDFLRRPVLVKVFEALGIEKGSRGLDAGCGIGSGTFPLAELVGSRGHVTGLDTNSRFLSYAEDIARKLGISERVSFVEGDMRRMPLEDDALDWVVSVDCACYPSDSDPAATVRELARVVRPGGTVAVVGWTSQRVLPGHVALEAMLNKASSLTLHSDTGTDFMTALNSFNDAGLTDCACRTFAGDVRSPLSGGERAALLSLFDMLWGNSRGEVSAQDWESYGHLCLEGSPGLVLDQTGYCAFFTYTAFQGTVPPT